MNIVSAESLRSSASIKAGAHLGGSWSVRSTSSALIKTRMLLEQLEPNSVFKAVSNSFLGSYRYVLQLARFTAC